MNSDYKELANNILWAESPVLSSPWYHRYIQMVSKIFLSFVNLLDKLHGKSMKAVTSTAKVYHKERIQIKNKPE